MLMIKIFTIGFSGKKENAFFDLLNAAEIKRLVDVRLWRKARFTPWASEMNLMQQLGEKYVYMPEFAPTKELLVRYKDGQTSWSGYEKIFNELMSGREVEKLFAIETLDGTCFLCSEKTPEMCHRRLVAEYLAGKFSNVEIIHL